MLFSSQMRLAMHKRLKTLAPNVYWQPPMNLQLKYPCVVYGRNNQNVLYANSNPYLVDHGIQITLISQDPDRLLDMGIELIRLYPTVRWQNDTTTDGLNHSQYQYTFR